MRRFAVGLVASVLTAGYWWAVFVFVYADALFAGDRDPAAAPVSDHDVMLRAGLAIGIGVLAYAVLAMAWRRATDRWRR